MTFEYHGWVALATSDLGWDDGDFERGFAKVQEIIARLTPAEGHYALFEETDLLPRMVHLNGCDVHSIERPEEVLKEIALVFNKAYGEIAVFQRGGMQDRWNESHVVRYVLSDGKIAQL
jgi:hypothetical protein